MGKDRIIANMGRHPNGMSPEVTRGIGWWMRGEILINYIPKGGGMAAFGITTGAAVAGCSFLSEQTPPAEEYVIGVEQTQDAMETRVVKIVEETQTAVAEKTPSPTPSKTPFPPKETPTIPVEAGSYCGVNPADILFQKGIEEYLALPYMSQEALFPPDGSPGPLPQGQEATVLAELNTEALIETEDLFQSGQFERVVVPDYVHQHVVANIGEEFRERVDSYSDVKGTSHKDRETPWLVNEMGRYGRTWKTLIDASVVEREGRKSVDGTPIMKKDGGYYQVAASRVGGYTETAIVDPDAEGPILPCEPSLVRVQGTKVDAVLIPGADFTDTTGAAWESPGESVVAVGQTATNEPGAEPGKDETSVPVEVKAFVEMTPRELFGLGRSDGTVEGGAYPHLHEAYFNYDGTENQELKELLDEQRLNLLQEHGKDITNLNTSKDVMYAYLSLLKEINSEKPERERVYALLSPYEMHQMINNIENVPDRMVFGGPARAGAKDLLGNEIGGFGGYYQLPPLQAYYFDSPEDRVVQVPNDIGVKEFYYISGIPEAMTFGYHDGATDSYILLLNTKLPEPKNQNYQPNFVPIGLFYRDFRRIELRAGSFYDNRKDEKGNPGQKVTIYNDAPIASTLDTWDWTKGSFTQREKLYPPHLWDAILEGQMVTTSLVNLKEFFVASFPPGAVETAQSPEKILAILKMARQLIVFKP